MKTPFVLLALIIAFCGNGCANGIAYDDPWFSTDKFEHAFISAGIAAGSTLMAKRADIAESSAPVIGFSTSFAVGIGKEAYDLRVRKTFWSWKDLCWDAVGGVLGSVAASR